MKRQMITTMLLSSFCLSFINFVPLYASQLQETLEVQKEGIDFALLTRARRNQTKSFNPISFTASSLSALDDTGASFVSTISSNLPIPAISLPSSSPSPTAVVGFQAPPNFNSSKSKIFQLGFFLQPESNTSEGGILSLSLEGTVARPGRSFSGNDAPPTFIKNVVKRVRVGSNPLNPSYYVAKFKINSEDIQPGDFIYLKIIRNNINIVGNTNLNFLALRVHSLPPILAIMRLAILQILDEGAATVE